MRTYGLPWILSLAMVPLTVAYNFVDTIVPGCPSLNASDFTNITDIYSIPNCFCDRQNENKNSAKITCLYTSVVANLSDTLEKCRKSKIPVDEIVLTNMNFDKTGIPDDFFANHNVRPSILTISNCLGNDKRLIFRNHTLRGLENSLIRLQIESCLLYSLPPTVAQMKNLRELILKETVIYFLYNDDFRHLQNLHHLDLSSNEMYYIELGTFDHLDKLETLILFTNGFNSSVFPELNKLKNLRDLDLSMNGVHSLPSGSFEKLSNLRRLNLAMNFIDVLRLDAFKGLTNLDTLDLSLNAVNYTDYNAFGADLANLRRLFLFSNYLTYVEPETFINLRNLESLDLSWNEITYLPPSAFESLTNLKYLNLSGNRNLFDVDDEAFSGLGPSLEYLNLSQTSVNSTQSMIDGNLHNITTLDLGHTLLRQLDGNLLKTTGKLKNLFLNDTKLTTLNASYFADLKKLETIDLSGDRLICDTNLIWLIKWIQSSQNGSERTNFLNSNYTTCWIPLELRGTALSGVNVDNMQPFRQITLGPSDSVDSNGTNLFPVSDPWADLSTQSTTAIIDMRNAFIDQAQKIDRPPVDTSSADRAKIIIIVVVVLGIVITTVVVTIVVIVMKRRRRKDKEMAVRNDIELTPKQNGHKISTDHEVQEPRHNGTSRNNTKDEQNHSSRKSQDKEEKYEDVEL